MRRNSSTRLFFAYGAAFLLFLAPVRKGQGQVQLDALDIASKYSSGDALKTLRLASQDLPIKEFIEETAAETSRVQDPEDKIKIQKQKFRDCKRRFSIHDKKTRRKIYNAFAKASNQIGDPQNAKELSDEVLATDPEDRDALNNRAISHLGFQNYRAAIGDATRVTDRYPEDETAYTTRALAHYHAGEYLQAVESSKHALALNKNNETAYATMHLAQNRINPSHLDLNETQLAQAQAIKNEYEAHVQQQTQVETVFKEQAAVPAKDLPEQPLLQQAAKETLQGYHWKAITTASRALGLNPRSAQAYYLRATAYNSAGEYRKAVDDATAALSLDPANTGALDMRSSAFLRLGLFNEALQDCGLSLRYRADNPYAFANCGKAHERLGNLAAAVSDYKSAAALNPQFEPNFRNALASMAPKKLPASAAPSQQPERAAASETNLKRYLWTLAWTLSGGLLIALGLVHLVLSSASRKTSSSRALTSPMVSEMILDHYDILRVIGEGGMGVVYEAQDKKLGRTVAIKKMRDELKLNNNERSRFLHEARTVAALHHPNIVEIHTILEDGKDLYLVFEYVPGETVADLIEKNRFLDLSQTKRVLRGACNALSYAHGHGVIHRDLKPANIMLTQEGQVKVMDFGIARTVQDAARKTLSYSTNSVVGTPQYMAPEAEQGIVRSESDVYSLGACLYEMTTGERPFQGMSAAARKLAMNYPKPSQLRPGLSAAMDSLIDDALQPDPDKRIKTPAEFMERLEAVIADA